MLVSTGPKAEPDIGSAISFKDVNLPDVTCVRREISSSGAPHRVLHRQPVWQTRRLGRKSPQSSRCKQFLERDALRFQLISMHATFVIDLLPAETELLDRLVNLIQEREDSGVAVYLT